MFNLFPCWSIILKKIFKDYIWVKKGNFSFKFGVHTCALVSAGIRTHAQLTVLVNPRPRGAQTPNFYATPEPYFPLPNID